METCFFVLQAQSFIFAASAWLWASIFEGGWLNWLVMSSRQTPPEKYHFLGRISLVHRRHSRFANCIVSCTVVRSSCFSIFFRASLYHTPVSLSHSLRAIDQSVHYKK